MFSNISEFEKTFTKYKVGKSTIFLFSLFHMLVHEKEIWLWRKTPNMVVARENVVVCILDVKSRLHGIWIQKLE